MNSDMSDHNSAYNGFAAAAAKRPYSHQLSSAVARFGGMVGTGHRGSPSAARYTHTICSTPPYTPTHLPKNSSNFCKSKDPPWPRKRCSCTVPWSSINLRWQVYVVWTQKAIEGRHWKCFLYSSLITNMVDTYTQHNRYKKQNELNYSKFFIAYITFYSLCCLKKIKVGM